jgi:class 3 adenylate cyclase/tetratricopeptide (TPR) repeat protein
VPAVDASREIRLVTCLFIDVVGSTDATVRLGPERMQRLLGEAFKEMSATVAAHGGIVEKYVGDAILALFGAPVSHADDAERALRAADACVRRPPGSASSAAGLSVRAGVETGELLVDLGALETRQRMVVGESINLAARLQQLAEPGQIVVGPTCHDATAAVAQYEPLGALSLKGLGAVESWRFTGFRVGEAARQVEFVGREAELASLHEAFERARQGTAMLALILGPPGQGKSRLTGEVIRRARPMGMLEARCRPGTETGVNSPLRQLVEGDLPGATPDAVHHRLSSLLGGSDGPDIAAAICHSSGLAVDERLLAISRYEQRELIAGAWRRYLGAVAGDLLFSVVVEDVHWADPLLLRVIDQVTSDLAAPLVVLATARPEFVGTAHLRPRENRVQIDLGPLDFPAVKRLVELAGDGTPTEGQSIERAGGNPLFIIELARSRSRASALPVTIQAAIAARLDELNPSERELLQRASVAGETFDVRDAALLGEREPGEVAAALGRIAHLGFVIPVGSSYRFHHALVHDVAYGRLPMVERMALHARYAVEGLDPGDVEALAHHWWEALKPPDADWVWEDKDRLTVMRREGYRFHLAAGGRLEQRNAYEEALEVYLRAVDLADATADRAAAEAAVGRAYARQGRGDDAWIYRLRAIERYREAGASPPAQLYADMLEITAFNWGYFHQLPGDADVLRLLDEGTDIARATGHDVSLARLLAERASFTGDVSGTDEIHRFLERPDAVAFADAAQRMATVYAWAGRVSDGVSLFETVFDRLIPAGALINEPEALAWYGMAAFYAGDLSRAETLADRLRMASVGRSVHTRSHAFSLNALVFFGRGDWDGLQSTTQDLRSLVTENPDASFCLLSAAAVAYATAAGVLAGGHLPADIDEQAKRHVDDSERVQAASVMLPKVMAADPDALDKGLRGYEPGLRLWDRYRTWDVADLIPAIAITILERWDALPPVLARLNEFATGGARLAEAAAAAIREEEAAAGGGPPPAHDQLLGLGYLGISELLRFRPVRVTEAA